MAAPAIAPKDIPAISCGESLCEVDFSVVALGFVSLVSDVAVVIGFVLEEVEVGEGVVVGRTRMEDGIALVLDDVIVGDPEALKIEVVLLVSLVVSTLLVVLVLLEMDVVEGVVELF